ncbi:MAG: hypothetical protein ACXV2C_03200 [Candidatus Bathyarchaeia archaeon]
MVDSHTTLKRVTRITAHQLPWVSGGNVIPSVINPRTIGFFFRLALIFEPLAPTAITYYVSRSLGDWKQKGLIGDYAVKTQRLHKFQYRILVDVDLTPFQVHYVLAHLLPKRISFLRRWFNV